MSGAPIANLEALLSALAKERSLRGRLRVLGHSWKLLRALSPVERERVALRLGSKWAWKRVEKTFLEDGELSDNERLVGQAFERMGSADPSELRKLARTIREGDAESARDLLMLTLTEALEEEAEEDGARSAALAPPQPEEEAPHGQPEPAAAEPEEAEPLVDAEALVGEGGVQDTPVPEARLVDRLEDVLRSSRARPVRPEPPAAHPDFERPPPWTPEPTPAISTPDRDGSAALVPRHPVAGTDRLRVLRALQRSDRSGADLGRADRAVLLESLGGGWASRRALTRMIRTHSLDGLDEALGLIRDLVRPGQQAWCLADLIEHWELDADELDRVLSAAPTDAARRRLQRRVRTG